jgi:excisionase family DNA binding protein
MARYPEQGGITVRLLSPEQAASYLALGSRWAVYRLVKAGEVPAVFIAGKLRVDRADLDALIERLKAGPHTAAAVEHSRAVRARASLGALAPPCRRNGDTSVTAATQSRVGAGPRRRATDMTSGVRGVTEAR